MPAANHYRIGDFELIVDRNLLEGGDGAARTLEPRAAELLAFLADRPGEVVSVGDLLDDLWRGRVVTDSSVYRLVAGLRQTLCDRARDPRYIETIRKRGYRLVAPVEVLDGRGAGAHAPRIGGQADQHPPRDGQTAGWEGPAAEREGAMSPPREAAPPAPASKAQPDAPAAPGSPPSPPARRPGAGPLIAGAALLLVVTLLVLAVPRLLPGMPGADDAGAGTTAGAARRTTVAVLPFESLDATPPPPYLTHGLARVLSDRLASIPELRVIAYPSVRAALEGETRRPPDLAATLGVDLLLSGTIRGAGAGAGAGAAADDDVRITVALLEPAGGEQRFTWSWRGALGELLSLEDAFAAAVTRRLDLTVVAPGRTEGDGVDPAAYRAALQAREALEQGFQRDNLTLAVERYTGALAVDPDYVPALAQRAVAHLRLYLNYHDRSDERLALARADVDQARSLAPDDARTLYAWGYYLQAIGEHERALIVLENALRRRPSSADILFALCRVQARRARLAGALASCTAAAEVDPRNAVHHYELGLTLMVAERFAEAERALATALSLDPGLIEAHLYRAVVYMAWLGDRQAANIELYRAADQLGFDRLIPLLLQPGTWGLLSWGDAALRERVARWDPREDGGDPAAWHLALAEFARLDDAAAADLRARGHFEQAARLRAQQVAEQPSDPWLVAELGLAYAGLGDAAGAMAAMDQAVAIAPVEDDPWTNADFLWLRATALVMLGRLDEAIAQVSDAVAYPGPMTPQMLRAEPLWAPVVEREGYRALLDDSGRAWRLRSGTAGS